MSTPPVIFQRTCEVAYSHKGMISSVKRSIRVSPRHLRTNTDKSQWSLEIKDSFSTVWHSHSEWHSLVVVDSSS